MRAPCDSFCRARKYSAAWLESNVMASSARCDQTCPPPVRVKPSKYSLSSWIANIGLAPKPVSLPPQERGAVTGERVGRSQPSSRLPHDPVSFREPDIFGVRGV